MKGPGLITLQLDPEGSRGGTLYNGGASTCRGREGRLLVLFNVRLSAHFFVSPQLSAYVRRAIIIRNNEIVAMSTEFTPESERQRLQFLVRKNRPVWFLCVLHKTVNNIRNEPRKESAYTSLMDE